MSTPQQNGVAERKNGHLLDTTRVFLFQKHLPKSYWGEVVLTATHLINPLPSRVLGFKSIMEVLPSFYPNMRTTNHLIPKIFGCVSFVHVHNPSRGKLDLRVVKCIFVGYSSTQKGYKYYHPPSNFFFVLSSMKVSLIFSLLILKGRIPSRKTRIEIPISSIPFPLTLPKSLVRYLCPLPSNLSLNLSRNPLSLLKFE